MAIVNSFRSAKKDKLKVEISAEILEQITSYCKWSEIDNIDYFIEEAATFVFAKDKEWKAYQKSLKRTKKNKTSEAV